MGTVISNLKARFGVDTSDFKSGLKDGEKAVESFKDTAGDSVGRLADLFGINMGAVNEALQTTQRSLNFLGQSFMGAAKGGNVLAIAMKALRVALISTGIGAIVVALGSLAAYFTKSGEGADKLAVALAQIKSVINNVIERTAILGKGLLQIVTGKFKEGWETMKGAVKGFGDEIKEDWKAAGDLAKAEDELYDRETRLIVSLEERRAKLEELRLAAKDLDKTEQERLSALQEAMAIQESMTRDEIALEAERLRIMKEKLAIAAGDPTDEQLREIAEQQAKLNSLQAQGSAAVRTMSREYNSLQKSIEAAAAAQKKLAEEAEAAWQKMVSSAKIETGDLIDVEGMASQLSVVGKNLGDSLTSFEADVASVVNGALENLAVGIGEFFGSLMIGESGLDNFGDKVAMVFAEMAIQVGKIAIAMGIATLAIDKALKNPATAAAAIVAGIALVAIGTAVRGALARSAGGDASASISTAAGGSGGGGSTGGNVWDLRTGLTGRNQEPIPVKVSGEFVIRGSSLVAAVEQEESRRNA